VSASDVLYLGGEGSSITLTSSSINFNEDIDMYGNKIEDVESIIFNDERRHPNRDGEVLYYDRSGTQAMEVYMGIYTYSFNLSFV